MAEAGDGMLRGSASATSTDNRGDGFFVSAKSTSAINDGILVGGLGASPVRMNFSVHLAGSASVGVGAANTLTFTPTATSAFFFRYALVSRAFNITDAISGMVSGCAKNSEPGISVCNGNFDFGPSGAFRVDMVIPLSLLVRNGDTIDLGLSLETSAFGKIGNDGDSTTARVDFAHTVSWEGLALDAASAGVTLTSFSGFDHALAAVPEPTSALLLLLGLGAVSGRRMMGGARVCDAAANPGDARRAA